MAERKRRFEIKINLKPGIDDDHLLDMIFEEAASHAAEHIQNPKGRPDCGFLYDPNPPNEPIGEWMVSER